MKRYIVILLFLSSLTVANAQKFGVRTGLNYSTFNGPLENSQEELNYSTGFNFGINYSYLVTDLFSVVFEFGYTQLGAKQRYVGDSYFIIREPEHTTYEKGQKDLNLTISNGYLTLPIVANFKMSKKIEVYGGGYANWLISPSGTGNFKFASDTRPEHIRFTQSLDYDYNSDKALGVKNIRGVTNIGIIVDDREFYFNKIVGAYHQFAEKNGNFINSWNFGLVGGFNYFLNRGFYAGLRAEYGLTDLTNNKMDASISTLDENNQFILRDDNDRHLGFNLSLGFRF